MLSISAYRRSGRQKSGICNEGETLLAPVREYVDAQQYAMNSTKKTKLVRAQLGNDAGIIGAALLGKQEEE